MANYHVVLLLMMSTVDISNRNLKIVVVLAVLTEKKTLKVLMTVINKLLMVITSTRTSISNVNQLYKITKRLQGSDSFQLACLYMRIMKTVT